MPEWWPSVTSKLWPASYCTEVSCVIYTPLATCSEIHIVNLVVDFTFPLWEIWRKTANRSELTSVSSTTILEALTWTIIIIICVASGCFSFVACSLGMVCSYNICRMRLCVSHNDIRSTSCMSWFYFYLYPCRAVYYLNRWYCWIMILMWIYSQGFWAGLVCMTFVSRHLLMCVLFKCLLSRGVRHRAVTKWQCQSQNIKVHPDRLCNMIWDQL